MAHTILYLISSFILFDFILNKSLSWLNLKTWEKPLPDEVKNLYEPEKYREAKDYAVANFKLGTTSSVLSMVISLTFLWMGGFAWLDDIVRSISGSPIVQALVFFAVLGGASMLISLPFDIYGTFVVEEKFGFNKVTPGIFVADKLKGIALGIVVGGGILALLTFLFGLLGNIFWLAAWGLISAITVFFAMFYASLIVPLFNKLTPLENGELRQAIENYAARVSFPLTNILVMDGSKRSTKANAFFSGLGGKKSIVLYDNLVDKMNQDEITAVLAHEVGHYKRKHVLQSIFITIAQMGFMFFLFGWLAQSPAMAEALGAEQNSFHLSLVAFALLYSPVSILTELLMNMLSRRNEYQADAYARETYGAAPLISSLKKLSVSHLSNLQPHPAYVFFNYSHPTLLQRVRAMSR